MLSCLQVPTPWATSPAVRLALQGPSALALLLPPLLPVLPAPIPTLEQPPAPPALLDGNVPPLMGPRTRLVLQGEPDLMPHCSCEEGANVPLFWYSKISLAKGGAQLYVVTTYALTQSHHLATVRCTTPISILKNTFFF